MIPKYNYNDIVKFKLKDEEIVGSVYIIDANGTFEQNEEPSYDILTDNCLYKHIIESNIYV